MRPLGLAESRETPESEPKQRHRDQVPLGGADLGLGIEVDGSRPRLDALIVGNDDFARAAGMPVEGSRGHLLPWLMTFVAAAKAHGLAILDGVWNDFADADGFVREYVQGRAMGMDGKTLIHPSQIEIANDRWTPGEAELAEARAIVAAFDDPAAARQGALQIDGRMVERLHLDMARRTLARAASLAR